MEITAHARSEAASLNCQYYLRSSPQYQLRQQLGEIGSRVSPPGVSVRLCNRARVCACV
jgi:hypothetical protein